MTENSIIVMSFEETKIPKFVERRGAASDKNWIMYGENNQYPQELITLFNRSAKHNAIVTGKAEYVTGNGLKAKDDAEADKFKIFEKLCFGGDIKGEVYKLALDQELFNGFDLEMIPTTDKKRWVASHIDFSKIRTNKEVSSFFYSNDWSKIAQTAEGTEFETYKPFNPSKFEKSLIYFKGYRPKSGLDTYPLPDYIGCMAYIECDYQISNFHVNNLRNGFTGSTIINFFTGEPTQEEQKSIEKKLKKKFAGTDNAGGLVIVFSDAKTKEPKIENIQPSDFDKQFDILNKTVQQEIFTGHKVTSPMLFGIKTEGQLGGRSEMIEAYEMFQNVYVKQRRQNILYVLDELAKSYGILGGLEFINLEPVSFNFSEAIYAQNMSRDEIRRFIKTQGIELDSEEAAVTTNSTVDKINSLSPLVANNVLSTLTPNELRGLIGMPPIADGDVLPSAQPDAAIPPSEIVMHTCSNVSEEKTDDEVLEIFSKYGRSAQEFTIIKTKYLHRRRSLAFGDEKGEQHLFIRISKDEAQALSLIKGNPQISVNEIAEALKISNDDALALWEEIKSKELVRVEEASGKIKVTEIGEKSLGEKKVVKISSMYQYGLSPYVSGPEKLPNGRTRPFCERLLELDKIYTRAELDLISKEVGYNVWVRRGGFYTNPVNGITTPFCRHIWEMKIVTEK